MVFGLMGRVVTACTYQVHLKFTNKCNQSWKWTFSIMAPSSRKFRGVDDAINRNIVNTPEPFSKDSNHSTFAHILTGEINTSTLETYVNEILIFNISFVHAMHSKWCYENLSCNKDMHCSLPVPLIMLASSLYQKLRDLNKKKTITNNTNNKVK